jgi:hypothetical protein
MKPCCSTPKSQGRVSCTMIASLLRYRCPFCSESIVHMAGMGPSPCPRCLRMVSLEDPMRHPEIPAWIWGVIVTLVACLTL